VDKDTELIVRHMSSGFLAVDRDWRVTMANPKASTLLRRPGDTLTRGSLWEACPGLEGSPAQEELRQVPGGRLERKIDFFSPVLYNWFDIRCVPATDGGVYVFFVDVSDRARAVQSEAVQSELRRILLEAPVAISITRGPDHRYDVINAASRALVGGRDLEGMTARNALPEVDPALFAILDDVYATGQAATLCDLEVTYDRVGDGSRYTGTFDITYQPMRGSDGNVDGIIQVAVETTRYAKWRAAAGEKTGQDRT
jgi:PAS domain-containing protein